jgi:uncharacterized tellurite resistance protein B-like protein
MFDRLIAFLQGLPAGADEPRLRADDDPRVAAAALMFHVMDADGVRSDNERATLRQALQDGFNLAGEELDAVLKAGERAEHEAIDLYAFTSVINRHLDEPQRMELIALIWQVVYADGEAHELEDNTVWRVAELIGVDQRSRNELRIRASGRTPTLEAVTEK